jgi:hypothetical protein
MASGEKRILFFQSQALGGPRGEILGASQSLAVDDTITLVAEGLIVRVFPTSSARALFSGVPEGDFFEVMPGRPVNLNANSAIDRIGSLLTGEQPALDVLCIPVHIRFCPCCC